MEKELIERYLYAAGKYLPKKEREHIKKEIRQAIEEQCKQLQQKEADVSEQEIIRRVLVDFGSPAQVAVEYSGRENQYLIGPKRYLRYISVLRLVLGCVAAGILISGIVTIAAGSPVPWYTVLWENIGDMISAMIMAYGIVTLVFSLMQRRGNSHIFSDPQLDELPEIPHNREKIPKLPAILSIAFIIVLTAMILLVPQYLAYAVQGSVRIPIFRSAVIRSHWTTVILIAAIGVVKECIRLYDGRYSMRVVITSIAADACEIVFCANLLLMEQIINPQFVQILEQILAKLHLQWDVFTQNLPVWILVAMSLIYILDMLVAFGKGVRYARH